MVRDLRRLADSHFDVLVVGAGIYGAIAAWDAASRGLSVALVDRGDFGGGTSFNNLKILHGGLRSLQAMHLGQMRLFIRERRALARIAPHLVRLLPCVVPTYATFMRRPAVMRAALALNDLVAHDRNKGLVDPATFVPASTVVSRGECLRMNPLIDPEGVTGGAVWHDYQMRHSDRLTLSFILSADAAGAAAANHVAVRGWLRDGARVIGATVEDRLGGATFDIRARVVVNAAGAWAGALLKDLPDTTGATAPPGLSRAMNLVVRHMGHSYGCGGLARGRFLFAVPWRDVSIVGTSHDPYRGPAVPAEGVDVPGEDVSRFLADAQTAFPRAALSASDVRLVHRGLLPVREDSGAEVALLRESAVVDHRDTGVEGLVSVFSVRYTTARHTAERAIDIACDSLGRKGLVCRTAVTPLVGGDVSSLEDHVRIVSSRRENQMTEQALRRVAVVYGSAVDALLRRTKADPSLGAPIGRQCDITAAEIVHAVEAEGAMTLADALLRRTEAGSAGHPGVDALARAADLMAARLEWSDAHRRREIDRIEATYRI